MVLMLPPLVLRLNDEEQRPSAFARLDPYGRCSILMYRGRPHQTEKFIRDDPSTEGVMAWVYLFFAGLLEIVWAFAMKLSDGFTHLVPSVITITAMLGSFGLLALAMRSLPLGTAYLIWTGIGAVGAFLAGVLLLGEAFTPLRAVAALLIISGIVAMKLSH
jgi:quaternary ammonium compound-resistance protein SugE